MMALIPFSNAVFVLWTLSNAISVSGETMDSGSDTLKMKSFSETDTRRKKRLRQGTRALVIGPIQNVVSNELGRLLLPHPQGPPHHKHQSPKGYSGCLGMSKDELSSAWIFEGEVPPCEIYVDGALAVGSESSSDGSSGSNNGNSFNSNSGTSAISSAKESESSNSDGGSANDAPYNDGVGNSGGSSSSSSGSGSNGNTSGASTSTNGTGSSENANISSNSASGSSENSSGSGGSNLNDSGATIDSSGSTVGSSSYNDLEENSITRDGGASSSGGTESSGYSNGASSNEPENDNAEGSSYLSTNGGSPPLTYFNLSDCGTYSNLWIWDLALSCDNATTLENCVCTSANILFQYGEIECPGTANFPSCPVNCPVCNTCMVLIGCPAENVKGEQRIPESIERNLSRALPVAFGIIAAFFTLSMFIYFVKQRNRVVNNSLQSRLMTEGVIL